MSHPLSVRSLDFGDHFEDFLVSAVASVLAIRLFLHLAGYPTVGGASLHVAHMLWGGLFMAAALLLLLGWLGRSVKALAAVLGVALLAVPALLVVAGILRMPNDRLAAYRRFQQAVLVLLLVTQFFAFYRDQLSAVYGLFNNLIVLITLNYMIDEERGRVGPDRPGPFPVG